MIMVNHRIIYYYYERKNHLYVCGWKCFKVSIIISLLLGGICARWGWWILMAHICLNFFICCVLLYRFITMLCLFIINLPHHCSQLSLSRAKKYLLSFMYLNNLLLYSFYFSSFQIVRIKPFFLILYSLFILLSSITIAICSLICRQSHLSSDRHLVACCFCIF